MAITSNNYPQSIISSSVTPIVNAEAQQRCTEGREVQGPPRKFVRKAKERSGSVVQPYLDSSENKSSGRNIGVLKSLNASPCESEHNNLDQSPAMNEKSFPVPRAPIEYHELGLSADLAEFEDRWARLADLFFSPASINSQ